MKCKNCDGTGCENGVPVAGRTCSECGGKGTVKLKYQAKGMTEEEKAAWAKMRAEFDEKRTVAGIKVLQTLSRLTQKAPYHRIGQLIENARYGKPWNDLFYLENDKLLEYLLDFETMIDEANNGNKLTGKEGS